MLIWSSISIIGLFTAHRTLNSVETLRIFSTLMMNQLRVFIFLTVVLMNLLFRNQISALLMFNFVIILSPWWAPVIIEKRRESSLKNEFLPILDSLILSMKSGKGFRQALQQCQERNSMVVGHLLSEFFCALQYQKEIQSLSSDPKVRFFFRELAQVDQSGHKPIERLKALRRRIWIEKIFRQKSRQALLQIRFQAWLIALMYVAAVIYVQVDFGIRKHWALVLTSSLIFSTGLIVIQKMGRNYKWKI